MRRIGPGRVRRKLAAMIADELANAGFKVSMNPENLIPNQGFWRIDWRADVMPWTGSVQVEMHGKVNSWILESWDTMTSLIDGFTWERNGFSIELFANKPRVHPETIRMKNG